MHDQLTEFTEHLPPDLLKRAFRARNEVAWGRKDAIEAITLLQKAGMTVLGVDVWIPSSRGPIVSSDFVYDWSPPGDDSVPGWPNSPQDFVRTFAWDPTDRNCKDHEPFFNLTVAKESD